MNGVNKTLYIPLYGKSYVSRKNIIIRDKKAEEIWEAADFSLKGKAKSRWLAYFMSMRAVVYDEWIKCKLVNAVTSVVLHIGCGLDSRVKRVSAENINWYDIDFADVIAERRKYYDESEFYHMLSADMRETGWESRIAGNQNAIVILEGVSMYFAPEELVELLSSLSHHFTSVSLLMDCYSERAAKISKYKNPIHEVGVNLVYGYDKPRELADKSGLVFLGEHSLTPMKYVNELQGLEKIIFQYLYEGKVAASMYKMYEFKKEQGGC